MSEEITKALQDVPVVSDDILIEREYERVMGQHLRPQDRAGVLKVCRAILALRPAVEPMTPEQREVLAALVVGACEHKTRTLLALRAIEATEAQYGIGITAKAEDARQPTKEADK